MSKKIKELELTALRTTFQGVKDYVILEPLKVDSATDFEFRKRLREKKARVQLVKNTFVKKVFSENGITVDAWSGPTLLVWGSDSIKTLSNTVDALIKDLKKDPKAPESFKVKTAVADGEAISFEDAKKRPTRLEAIGEIVGALMGAGSAIAGCLTGPASQLAGILSTIEEKGGAAGGAAPAPEAAAAG
jgi:ribosomal protein L10